MGRLCWLRQGAAQSAPALGWYKVQQSVQQPLNRPLTSPSMPTTLDVSLTWVWFRYLVGGSHSSSNLHAVAGQGTPEGMGRAGDPIRDEWQ